MCKHAETFHANKGYKLEFVDFIPNSLYSKYKFVVHFSNVICTKTRPCIPLLFKWKWTTSTLSFIRLETNGNVFSPCGLVFLTGPFLRGPFFLRSRVRVQVRFLDDAIGIIFQSVVSYVTLIQLKLIWQLH